MVRAQFMFMILLVVPGFGFVIPQTPLSIIYTIPQHQGTHISADTTIVLRQGNLLDAASVSPSLFHVRGSVSHNHVGSTHLSDDRRTIIFTPATAFTPGETVDVTVSDGLRTEEGHPIHGTRFTFTIAVLAGAAPEITKNTAAHTAVQQPASYITLPDTEKIPQLDVTTPAQDTADGLIFAAPLRLDGVTPPHLMILEHTGEPVYARSFPAGTFIGNVRPFTVDNKQVLTYFYGTTYYSGWITGKTYVLNNAYQLIDTWEAGNGYTAEAHDFYLLDNGHALITVYYPTVVDMTAYGGSANATVVEFLFQELDASKNVVFEWHSTGRIPYTDSYVDLTAPLVDYFHGNAVALDTDGDFLVSARNTSEIVKIDRETGDILWRLGGKGNQFIFTNDNGFTAQHDIRRTETGTLTLFDNGVWNHPSYSRAVEYSIDEQNKTVTRVWEYRNSPDMYGDIMGNAQRLPNGNTLIGWGSGPAITEVRPDGKQAFELRHETFMGYRAYRLPWHGTPATPPALVATSTELAMSWNGATEVAAYRVYGGSTPYDQQLLATIPRDGFETTIPLDMLPNTSQLCSIHIEPIDAQGNVLGESETVAATCDAVVHRVMLPIVKQ